MNILLSILPWVVLILIVVVLVILWVLLQGFLQFF